MGPRTVGLRSDRLLPESANPGQRSVKSQGESPQERNKRETEEGRSERVRRVESRHSGVHSIYRYKVRPCIVSLEILTSLGGRKGYLITHAAGEETEEEREAVLTYPGSHS